VYNVELPSSNIRYRSHELGGAKSGFLGFSRGKTTSGSIKISKT